MSYSTGKFLQTPITTLAEAATAADGTAFNSARLEIIDPLDEVAVICEVTGGLAACALEVHFVFQVSIDGILWVPWDGTTPIVATLNGVTPVRVGAVGGFQSCRYMRLASVENNESVSGRTATSIQVTWGRPWSL